MSSILDNLAQNNANDWLSEKLNDNPEEDQALQTTARIATAHIWPFLASAISDDDYWARKGVKTDEVTYICSGIAAHTASAQPLVDYVMAGFDRDYATMRQASQVHRAQEEALLEPLLEGLGSGALSGGAGGGQRDDEDGPFSTPKVSHQAAGPSSIWSGPNFDSNDDDDDDDQIQGHDQAPGLPDAQSQDKDESDSDSDAAPPPLRHHNPKGPGFFDAPKVDQELEPDISSYYGPWGPGNPNRQSASLHVASTVGYGDEAVPFELLSPEERTAHIAEGHQMDPSAIKGMSALGSQALHQVLHDEAGLDVQHYHPRGDYMGSDPGISIDHYGHILVGAYDRSRDPQLEENDDPDPDRYWADQDAGNPENDVYEHPEHSQVFHRREYQPKPRNRVPKTWKTSAHTDEVPIPDAPAHGERAPAVKAMSHSDLLGHMSEFHFGPGPWRDSAEAAVQKTMGLAPGRLQFVHNNSHEQGSRMHEEHTHDEGASHPEHGQERRSKAQPVREGQLARPAQRPLEGHWRSAVYESGYDPSEGFPGYYGEAQPPLRARTAQAPGPGESDVPVINGAPGSAPTTPNVGPPPPPTPASTTGASGMFDPGDALNTSSPAGPVSGNFAQADTPQDIQAQLGQIPTLSHRIGAKLAEMASEAMAHNPDLTAVAAMELSLKALRLYPKVAMGGADYLAEPERLEDCPQCARRAYNPEINRCHFCGFYDAGVEPSIEVT